MFRHLLGIVGLGVLLAAPAAVAQTPRVAEIQIAPPFVRMVPDAQVQVSATAYDSAGTPVAVRFRWTSSNINVATVTENGLVRGLAPGTALITAIQESQRGGRRRTMQVQVLSRAGASVSVTPPAYPPAGGLPPGPPPSAMPPGPPPMVLVTPRGMDSTLKASINCDEPMLNAVNPLQACYDQRPTPRSPAPAALAPCPDQRGGMNGPAGGGLLVLVRVTDAGAVADAMPFVRAGCPELVQAALQAARATSFNPALKDGRPVAAWARLVLHITEPPPKQ